MSPASHMASRLRKLYGIVWSRMRLLNERQVHPPHNRPASAGQCVVEQLEARLFLSSDPLGGQLHLNRSTGGDQTDVAVDADSAGNYVAVWQGANAQGWGTQDIYFQRFNTEGTPLSPEVRANPDWVGEQSQPDVAVADDGRFVVTWTHDNDGNSYGVYGRIFAADGSPLTDAFRVNTYTTGNQSDSEVAVNVVTGDFVVVWQSEGQDGSTWGVYGQRYNSAGVAQGAEFLVNTYTNDQQSNPAVAMDADGDFAISWQSHGQDGSSWGVYGQRYNAAGTALGSEFRVNTYTSDQQTNPAVAMDGGGNLVIAWDDRWQDGSDWGVYGQRYDSAGVAQGAEFRVNTYTSSSQGGPAVAMDSTGGFVVAWHSYTQDGSGNGVYAQRYAADGTAQGGEFRANTYTYSEQHTPAAAFGANGDLLIAWQSYPSDEEGWSWGVFGQFYGSGLSQADLVPVRVTGPDGANLGQTISISAEIRNQGSVAAGAFTCQYYLSTDAIITTADTPLGGQFTVSGLAAYATYTDSRQIQVALDVPTGDFHVGLLVDVNDQVAEADEANNGTATVHPGTMDVRSPAPTLGGQLHLNRSTAGDQQVVAVDADSAGNYVAVWQGPNAQGWGTNDIYFQRYNALGTPLGPEVRANPDWVGEQSQPDMAVADDGRFVVTWTHDNDGNSYGVYGRIFAADGSPLTDAFRVNTYTTGNQSDSEVAVNVVTGDFVVVWGSEGQDESSWGVYGQRFNSTGAALGSEFRVNTCTSDQQSNPAVAMDADGDFAISWQSHGQDGSSWGVYGQRYNAAGTALGSEFRGNTYTSSQQSDPALAMDTDGGFVVAWQSNGQDGSSWGVYGQRYSAAGMALGSEFRVNTYTSSQQSDPAVAMDTDGEFVVAWQSDQDGSSWGVYGQRYASDGTAHGGEFRANTYTYYYQQTPAVAFGAGGDLLIAWQSHPSDEEGWSWGIFGQFYGSGLSQADLVPVRVTGSDGANLGQTISVSAEIRNQGSLAAGAFTCQYYLSTDATITTADTPLGDAIEVAGVGAYQTYSDSRTLAVPNVVAGDWYVGVIVDTADAVAEADETNNVYRTSYNEPAVDIAALPLFGPEFRVNTTTADSQSAQVVGFDSAGNFVVVWQSQGQDGSGLGIYGRRYDAAGSPVGGEFRVNTTTSADQAAPALAVASDGRFVVTWHSQNQDSSGWGVYARLYGADGQALTGEFRVNTYTNSDQNDQSVGIDGAGNFIIVWYSAGQDAGNNGGIYGQRYLANGSPNGTEFWVCSNASPDQYRPVVAMSAAGQFVVAWDNGDNTYARRFMANGTAADDEFVVNSYTSDQQNCPSVAMDASGNFVVAWRSNGQDGSSWGVYAQRYAANGARLGGELQVNKYTSGEQRDPSVAMDAGGNFVVAWHSNGQDGDNWAVVARRYGADGSPIGGEFRVNSFTTNEQSWPAVAALDQDHFIIVWQSAGQDGSSYGVYGRLFGLTNVEGLPNLVVSQVSGPGSVYPGGSVALNVTIRNTGMTVAPASTARLWLSDDNVFGNADDRDTGIQLSVPSILSEQGSNSYSTTVNYTWPAVDPFGTDRDYYFILQADSALAVVEANEADNAGVSNLAELRLPDLTGSVTVPSSIVPGQAVSIAVNIWNNGDAQAGASTAHLWLSDDNVIGNADDIDLHIDIPIPTVRTYYWPDYSYQTYQTTVQYTWPEPDPYGTDGQYFFVLGMDVTNAVVEASETNNYGLSNSFGVNRPNLVVYSLSGPTQVQPGQNVTYSLDVRNTGTATAGASVLHLWLSDDATGGNADDHDLLIDVQVPSLATYTWQNNYPTFQTNVTFTWPAADPFGTDLQYYVLAKADAANQVAEGNEADNYRASSAVALLVPDLEFVALRAATTVQAGQLLSVHLTARNAGGQAAPASTAHLWLSDDNIVGNADDRELTPPLDISVPAIAGNATWSSDITIPWPQVDPFGTDGEYFLAVRMDAGNHVAEGNEVNNTGLSGPLALVAPMDLDMDLVGHFGGASLAVAVQGDYAYELTTAGLRVLDVRDAAQLHRVSEIVFPVKVQYLNQAGQQQALAVLAVGDRLYVVDGAYTRIFDLAVPYQPVLLAEHEADVAALAIQGRIAFIGDGEDPQLDIVDLSDPANPQVLAEYNLRGEARGLVVQGSLAYVTYTDPVFHRAAIEVVNIANLFAPAFVSRRALDAEGTGPLAVNGSLLAVAVGDMSYYVGDMSYYDVSYCDVVLIDVSAPTLPRVKGRCEPGGNVNALSLTGTSLFVSQYGYYGNGETALLTVIDVTDPADPAMIAAVDLSEYYYAPYGRTNLIVAGSRAYYAGGDLDVVDLSSRFDPTVVGTYSEPYSLGNIAVSGSIACVARGWTLELIDTSEPSMPRLVGTYQSSLSAIDHVLASGTRAFLVQGNKLEIVDISSPASPRLLASHDLPNNSSGLLDVEVQGGLLYVLEGSNCSSSTGKLHVIGVSDPADMEVLSSTDLFLYAEPKYVYYEGEAYQVGYSTAQLAVQGDHVFISNTHPSDPEPNDTPQTAIQLGGLSQPVVVRGVGTGGNKYYAVHGEAGDQMNVELREATYGYGMITDSSGNNLAYHEIRQGVATYELPQSGDYLAVAYYTYGAYELAISLNDPLPAPQPFRGLSEFDMSDPANPVLLSTANIGQVAQGIAADGEMVYVTLSNPGMLQACDFSDAAHPVQRGSAQVDQAGDLRISGNLATIVANVPGGQFYSGTGYVTVPESGKVQVVDVSDPDRPVALESYETGRNIGGLAAQGMLNYFAADSLYALSIRPAGVESADLAVTQLTTAPAVTLGSMLNVGWTVRNLGRAAAEGTWTDTVYLSADASLDAADVLLGEAPHTGPLASLGTYTAAMSPVIHNVAPGYYYLIAVTDSGDDVNEWFVEANNLRVSSQPIYVGYPDLAVTNITVPEVIDRGDPLPVQWTVYNRDLAPAGGAWSDQVYLSRDTIIDAGDMLVGTLPHDGGLAQRQVYHAGLDIDTASLADDVYYLIVKADAGAVVDESGRTANNVRVSSAFRLGVPAMTLGEPLTDTFDFARQYKYYRVSVDAGQHLFVSLNDLNDTGSNELYIKYGSAPTRSDYDAKYSANLAADQVVEISNTQAGNYYVLAYAASTPDAPGQFALTAAILDFEILGISPSIVGNAGRATLSLRGSKFPPAASAFLISPEGQRVSSIQTIRYSEGMLYATFNTSDLLPGIYDVGVEDKAGVNSVVQRFLTVNVGVGAAVWANLVVPQSVRLGVPFTFRLEYGNSGDADCDAPLISIQTSQGIAWKQSGPSATLASLYDILATASSGPPGTIPPGRTESLSFEATWSNWAIPPVIREWRIKDVQRLSPASLIEQLGGNILVTPWKEVLVDVETRLGSDQTAYAHAIADAANHVWLEFAEVEMSPKRLVSSIILDSLATLVAGADRASDAGLAAPAQIPASASMYPFPTDPKYDGIGSRLRGSEWGAFEDHWVPWKPASLPTPAQMAQYKKDLDWRIAWRIKPLMLWDPEIDRWFNTWKSGTGGKVEYQPDDSFSVDVAEYLGQDQYAALSAMLAKFQDDLEPWLANDPSIPIGNSSTTFAIPHSVEDKVTFAPLIVPDIGRASWCFGNVDLETRPIAAQVTTLRIQDGTPQRAGDIVDYTAYVPLRVSDVFSIDEHVANSALPKPIYKGDPTWFYMPFYMYQEFGPAKPFDWIVNFVYPASGEVILNGVAADAGNDIVVALEKGQSTTQVTLHGSAAQVVGCTLDSTPFVWTGSHDPADVQSPTVDLAAGTYTFSLRVGAHNDQKSYWDTDTVNVVVIPYDGEDEKTPTPVRSWDPNDKVGPAGYGPGRYVVPDATMPYTIYYENDPGLGATAPAQVVRIEDTLDTDLDLATFELGDMNLYGGYWVTVPAGLQYYQTLADLRPEGVDLLVRVTAGLDSDSRKVTWLFESLDPDTMAPPEDAMAGFLPVNDKDLHDGEGHLGYTIRPVAGLASGVQITNQAFNYFDTNAAVPTPTTLNTVDAGKPASAVQALAAQLPDEPFTVSWAGQDDANGSGVGSYTVYVSDNGGAWQAWLTDTTVTSATFTGVGGHSYAFRSVARDNVGYVEDDPGATEATTTLDFSQFRVNRLEATPSGFVAHFRRALDVSALNLYDVQAGIFGQADLTVVGAAVGPVAGSLLYDQQARTVTFIKTGGPLAADTYTVTLRSGSDAFKDSDGHLLDGDADGVEGGDYVNAVTVEASTARMLSLPDFTRGPGQAVNVPATGAGIPVSIDNGSGILGIDFVLEYDPAMLTVTNVTLASGMPAGWSVERDLGTPGLVSVWVFGQTPLTAGARDLVRVSASVPNAAAYSSAGLIRLENLSINEGGISSATDSAVQVVAYLGDATGNHAYSALDAAYLARVGVGLDGGFAAYRMKDPVLLADTTGNGTLSSLDASYLARKGVGLPQPEIPNLPGVLPAIIEGGPDPLMSVPNLTALPGGRVSVPVLLDDATGLQAADICLRYDTAMLDLTDADVSVGALTVGWTVTANVNDAAGEVRLWVYSTNILAGGSGSIAELNFAVAPGVQLGQAFLDLADSSLLNEGHLVLTLQDGQVTIKQPPSLSINDAQVTEGDSGTTEMVFTINLSSASTDVVTLDYSTANGTANDRDYVAKAGSLSFDPGQTQQTVRVPITGDLMVEGDETFMVNVTGVVNAVVQDGQAVGTIVDNDLADTANPHAIDPVLGFAYLDADGDQVTVKLSGGGKGSVILRLPKPGQNAAKVDAYRVLLDSTTTASALSISVKKISGDGRATIQDVVVTNGSLKSIDGKQVDLMGDLLVDGSLGTVALGDVRGQHRIEARRNNLAPYDAKAKLTLSMGRLADVVIITHDEPIQSLTALEWLDTDQTADSIIAPWIGTLSITGRLASAYYHLDAIAGDFQADMTLSGTAAPLNKVLGATTVKGAASGDWVLTTGATGIINVGSTTSTFSLTTAGQVAGFNSTVGGIEGSLSALYFDAISAKGMMQAAITANGAAATTGKAIGTLSAGSVNDTTITASAGGIGTITALEWLDGDPGVADITTRWVGTMNITGRLASAYYQLSAIAGDFQADMALSGASAPLNKVLGTATVKGAASGDWILTTGATGIINVGSTTGAFSLTTAGQVAGFNSTVGGIEGSLSALYFDKIAAKGLMQATITATVAAPLGNKAIGTFSAGSVNNTTITANAGGIGTITALEWLDADPDADITTRWIGTMNVTGRLATTLLPLIAGNFQADMTLSGTAAPLNKVLGTATVKGAASGDWALTTGNTGLINVGSTTGAFSLTAPGQVAGVNATGGIEGALSALYFDKIAAKGLVQAGITATGAAAIGGKAIGTFSAGSVVNAAITANAGGIGTITALEWIDADPDVDIATRWIGTMNITGRLATLALPLIAGNFGADMTLSGTAAPLNKVLGTATVKGATSGDWMLTTGNTGLINVGSTTSAFSLTAPGQVAGFNATVAGIEGALSALYFDAISAKGLVSAVISASGAAATTGKAIGTFAAGSVNNTTITANAGGIGTITALEWLDADPDADITTRWIGTMSIPGRLATTLLPLIAGNFQADVTLTGTAAPLNKVLGTATIKGAASGDWMLTAGNTGIINVGSTAGGFTLGAAGLVAGVNVARDLLGDLTANKFTSIVAKGNLGAGIHVTGDPARQDTTIGTLTAGTICNLALDIAGSIGTMTAGVVTDVSLTLSGGVTTMTVTEWNNADGLADRIKAGWIGTMKTLKNAKLPAVLGDFEASLDLTGVGAPAGKTLGTATIAGSVTSTNSDASRLIWNVAGQAGAVTIGGAVNALTAHASKSMTSFQAGAVTDAQLTVDDALGSAKALCWNAGKIEADSIGTLAVTGRLAAGAVPAIAGDFGANLTVKGLKSAATAAVLGTATIAHDVTGGTWSIDAAAMAARTANTVTTITVNHDVTAGAWKIIGSAGTLNINGTATNSMIRASGTITTLNLGATNGSEFQAGVTVEKASADMLVADVNNLSAIKTINVKGWTVPAGQPKQFFVKDSSFLAGQIGTVSFTNAAGMDSFDIYVPDPVTDVKSVKNTDKVTPTNNWTWPSVNWVGSPPITAIAP